MCWNKVIIEYWLNGEFILDLIEQKQRKI